MTTFEGMPVTVLLTNARAKFMVIQARECETPGFKVRVRLDYPVVDVIDLYSWERIPYKKISDTKLELALDLPYIAGRYVSFHYHYTDKPEIDSR